MNAVIAPTENFVLSEKTSFSADEVIGQTVLSVNNAQGFVANSYIVLGNLGYEKAEIAKIASIDTGLITITITSGTKHAHSEGELITKIFYNQRKFYRSTTESGTYTHLTSEGSPVNLKVDDPSGTCLEDSSGLSTSWYKSTYYNSTTGQESDIDDAIATKAGEVEFYTSIYKVKAEAGLQDNSYISDELVDSYRLESQNEVDSIISGVYSVPLSVIPKIIEHITRLLAAGLLLQKEYGMESDLEINKTGERKITRAKELLDKIVAGSMKLIGPDGVALSTGTVLKASSSNVYNGTTEDLGEMFNIGDEYFRMKDPANPKS